MRILAGVAAVLVLSAGFVVYKINNRSAPSFRAGGEFASGALSPSSTSTSGSAPTATTVGTAATATTVGTAGSTTTQTTGTLRASTSTTAARASSPTTGPRADSGASPPPGSQPGPVAPGPAPAESPAGPPQASPVPVGVGFPALGVYAYAVEGQEEFPVGSRSFPAQMTTTVHLGEGLKGDQRVFDLNYSEEHEEREIVGFRSDGIYFDFEAGSVSFGPRTETSEADYDPPMLQIPLPLSAGLKKSGTSQARNAGGDVIRTENWKVSVVGQEKVTVAGAAVDTWKVQMDRTFTGGESGTRHRTFWFDPARSIWVKYLDELHAKRKQGGIDLTYDSKVTATLSKFTPV